MLHREKVTAYKSGLGAVQPSNFARDKGNYDKLTDNLHQYEMH